MHSSAFTTSRSNYGMRFSARVYHVPQGRARFLQRLPRNSCIAFIAGLGPQELSFVLPRGPRYFESGRCVDRLTPPTPAVAAWCKEVSSALYSHCIESSNGDNASYIRYGGGLGRSVESGYDFSTTCSRRSQLLALDTPNYPLSTLPIGHKNTADQTVGRSGHFALVRWVRSSCRSGPSRTSTAAMV